jgi:hypothetical protein
MRITETERVGGAVTLVHSYSRGAWFETQPGRSLDGHDRIILPFDIMIVYILVQ